MHLRKLVLACGFASFALSNYASALGLGEVKLKSTLNQPLSAEVQLLDTKGLSSEQIIVALASSGDFERNGLDFVHFYTEFRFEVALDNPGGPVVRITSRNPVREPYLNFLVEAKWTSGRLLREYTLLMDLPTFDDKAPQAVQAAPSSQSKSPAATANQTPANAAVAAEIQAAVDAANAEAKPDIIAEQDQPAKKSKAAAGTYGPVGGKDTLWDIALAVRPDSSTNIHQTMLALQRLNPDAFIRGNINLLKKGQVLRVPDSGEISSLSQSEAVRQFNTQVAEWSGASTGGSTGLGAQLDATRRTSAAAPKSESVAGRVKLEAPSAKDKTANGQGSGANKGAGKALESELASALEELDKAKSEKTELSSRVHDLEDQVKTMQRLVDVSNEKLRALQLNSAKQPEKDAAKTPVAVPPVAEVKESAVAVSAAAISQAPAVAATAEAISSVAAVVPKKVVPKAVVPKAPPEKSIVDLLFDNILWVGVGAAAILGAAAFAIVRRRKSQAEEAQSRGNSEELFDSEPNFDAFHQADEEIAEVDTSADEMSLFDEEDTTAVAETGDVVGEADIYIAYGKFDQAEEMLVNGLEKDPSSTEIRLKLLEVYSQTQNINEFDKHYAAILPLATAFALGRAKELRANIPGAGEFSADVASAHQEESHDLDDDFSLDDFESSHEEPLADTAGDDLSFDLDLDDDSDLSAGTASTNYGMDFTDKTVVGKTTNVDDDFLLDFDLDDSAAKRHESDAEDLSEISLALDGLDNDNLPEDIEIAEQEDEFSFDFNDMDNEPSSLAEEVGSIKSSGFNEEDATTDDFNLEMDVNKLDLAALDSEMAGFDAELDQLDDEEPVGSTKVDAEFARLEAEEFTAESLDDELADLDENLTFEELESLDDVDADSELEEGLVDLDDSLETELDESEFAWDESDDSTLELGDADDDLKLDVEDDFDIDSPVSLANENSLHDLDEELAEESELDLDDTSFDELVTETELESSAADEFVFDEPASAPVAEVEDDEAAEDDDLFEQALSDFSAESLALEDASDLSDDDLDSELDFMADADEAATKLDLARAYIDMGDSEGARDILAEVAHEGNEQQRQEAVDLLSRIDA
jgi:pilus assembly protein FimV